MKKTISSEEMRFVEKLLVRLDAPSWEAIYRAAIGYATPLAM
jgi:hypothetical protein